MNMTGYTSRITEGINFREFTLRCAKAFSTALREMDEPEPDKVEMSTYDIDRLAICESELNHIRQLDKDELQKEVDKAYENSYKNLIENLSKNESFEKGCKDMLKQVTAWEPPIAYYNLKIFMIKHLQISDNDSAVIRIKNELKELEKPDLEVWRQERMGELIEEIKYHRKEYEEEVECNQEVNEWYQQLRDSLPKEEL